MSSCPLLEEANVFERWADRRTFDRTRKVLDLLSYPGIPEEDMPDRLKELLIQVTDGTEAVRRATLCIVYIATDELTRVTGS